MKNNQNTPIICALATPSHLPLALTMADSFILHHPHGKVFMLQIGGEKMNFPTRREYLTMIELSDLNADEELDSMRERYDVFEFCNALKPYFLNYLLENTDCHKICYFDSDLYVLGNMEREVWKKLDNCSIMLTPHYLNPSEKNDEEVFQRELETIIRGVYNAGFVGIRRGENARKFINWWKEKVFRGCYRRPEEGMFVDQRWLDLAAAFDLNTRINRHPGLNVAFWNLHERKISLQKGKFLVNQKPLLFFHLSGYSPTKPDFISKFNQLKFSDFPHLRGIFDDYAKKLMNTKLELEQQLMQQVLAGELPSVSVIISTSNDKKSLSQTIESVSQQTISPTEIIVLDSVSTDTIIDEKITIVETKDLAIKQATAKFIIFLEAGDYFLFPTALEKQISVFRQENCAFGIGGWREIKENRQKFNEHLVWQKAKVLTLKQLLSMFVLQPSTIIFRRSHLLKIGGFKPELFPFEFLDTCSRLMQNGFSGEWVKRVTVACRQTKQTSATLKLQLTAMTKFVDSFFQNKALSAEILRLEEKIRFDWLVWFAYNFYQIGNFQEMKKTLLESLNHTKLTVRGALVYWLSRFSRFAHKERKSFDSFNLIESKEWQELESLQFENQKLKTKNQRLQEL
jgi:glycosyltransferase involved in cell wall biosynthesis